MSSVKDLRTNIFSKVFVKFSGSILTKKKKKKAEKYFRKLISMVINIQHNVKISFVRAIKF